MSNWLKEKRFLINRECLDYNSENDLTSSYSERFDNFENQYNTFYKDFYEEDEIYIPTSIFSREIGCFQSIVKYLKEKKNFKFSKIAVLTNRDQRTIWNTYNQAKNLSLSTKESETSIPLSIIKNRKTSVLGHIISHLKDTDVSFNQIALILDRNYQTIYTTYRKTRRMNK